MNKSNFPAVVQVRMGSTRLPGKSMMRIDGTEPLIGYLLKKLTFLFEQNQIYVATTEDASDDELFFYCQSIGFQVYRGSVDDVLGRFASCLEYFNISNPWVYRICGDNPFLDLELLSNLGTKASRFSEFDYISYANYKGVPVIRCHYGLFGELIKKETLMQVNKAHLDQHFREHVTNYIYSNPDQFKVKLLTPDIPVLKKEDIRLTIDTSSDFEMAKRIINDLEEPIDSTKLLAYIQENPDLLIEMQQNINKNSK